MRAESLRKIWLRTCSLYTRAQRNVPRLCIATSDAAIFAQRRPRLRYVICFQRIGRLRATYVQSLARGLTSSETVRPITSRIAHCSGHLKEWRCYEIVELIAGGKLGFTLNVAYRLEKEMKRSRRRLKLLLRAF